MLSNIEPIFIVGAPRSGTTWLLTMLEQHPQCFGVTPDALGIETKRPTKETGIFIRGFSTNEIVERFSRLPRNLIPVEKTPGHLLQVGRIKRIFPKAKIVLVKRNPEDVIWSMLQENSFWQDSPKKLPDAVDLYNSYAQAQEAYYGYDAVIEYESIWSDPVGNLSNLLSVLGLDSEPAQRLVNLSAGGKSLPKELAGVFRNGQPGEGEGSFSESEAEYLRGNLFVHGQDFGKLSILLTNNHLYGWSGSETLLISIMNGLLEQGHRLVVYARHLNSEWLDFNFDSRVRVTDNLETIRNEHFDLAHVHHSSCLIDVRVFFPRLPIVFSSLGVLPFLEQPCPLDVGVSRYLALSEEVADNLIMSGIESNRICIIRNIVDENKFHETFPISELPLRILVLSNKIDNERKELIIDAARRVGAKVNFVGRDFPLSQEHLNESINESDIVISLGRGVIETMFCGRVPLVFDIHGGDGLVTPSNFQELWKCNFSGRVHKKQYNTDELIGEISKYSKSFGKELKELAIFHFGLENNINKLVNIYSEVVNEGSAMISNRSLLMAEFIHSLSREDNRFFNEAIQGCHDEIRRGGMEILRVKSTVSWRLTRPLRFCSFLWRYMRLQVSKIFASFR